jgi:hypothetical protein
MRVPPPCGTRRERGDDPGEQIRGRSVPSDLRSEDFERRRPIVPIDPLQDVAHGELLRGGGMEERGEQRAGPLGPVMLAGALPTQPAGADHGLSRDDGRVPIGGGGER